MNNVLAHSTPLGTWRFVKRAGLSHIVTPGGIQVAASGSAPGSGIGGADVLGVGEAAPPAGATLHRMRFGFRSGGFFAEEPGAHLAIGLAAKWRKDNPSTPQFDGALMGRGLAIGNISGAPNGCPEWPVIQIESFRGEGNALYPQTCSPRLSEGVRYEVELSVGVAGGISYRLVADVRALFAEHRADDGGANIPSDLGGWWIFHCFSDSNPAAEWTIDFEDLAVWWE